MSRFEIYYSCPTMTQMPIVADNSTAEELVRRELAALVQYDASCCDPWDLEAVQRAVEWSSGSSAESFQALRRSTCLLRIFIFTVCYILHQVGSLEHLRFLVERSSTLRLWCTFRECIK